MLRGAYTHFLHMRKIRSKQEEKISISRLWDKFLYYEKEEARRKDIAIAVKAPITTLIRKRKSKQEEKTSLSRLWLQLLSKPEKEEARKPEKILLTAVLQRLCAENQ